MREIKKIVVHVSDTPDGVDFTAKHIRDWHIQQGWKDIGYHKVVRIMGQIEDGRPEDQIGAHVKGHNSDSLGIVWIGDVSCSTPQMTSLKSQVLKWIDEHNLSPDDVYGHCEFDSSKTCPNIDMNLFRENLRLTINARSQENNKVSTEKTEYLPDGPSEDDINVTLEEIEKQIIED